MKASNLLIAASLAANLGFAGYVVFKPSGARSYQNSGEDAEIYSKPTVVAKPTTDVAADTWEKVVSHDLPTYTANLYAAGLPERLVRAIINAEINERFKGREEALRGKREKRGFWEGENFYDDKTTLEMRLAQIDLRREKEALRKQLLGEPPQTGPDDNPIPKEKRDPLRQINEDYDTMISQIQREARGVNLPEDEEKLRYLRAEKEAELKALLTPAEYAEHQLRTSQTANQMRYDLSAFKPSEEEFRALHAMRSQFDQEFPNPQGDPGQDFWKRRSEAEKAMQAKIEQDLGAERYKDYLRSKDYDFRNLSGLTERLGLPPKAAAQVYDLRYSLSDQALAINDNKSLDGAARAAALKTLAAQTRAQIYAQLGQEAGDAYMKRSNYNQIDMLEKGQLVIYRPGGGREHRMMRTDPQKK